MPWWCCTWEGAHRSPMECSAVPWCTLCVFVRSSKYNFPPGSVHLPPQGPFIFQAWNSNGLPNHPPATPAPRQRPRCWAAAARTAACGAACVPDLNTHPISCFPYHFMFGDSGVQPACLQVWCSVTQAGARAGARSKSWKDPAPHPIPYIHPPVRQPVPHPRPHPTQ